MAKRMITVAAIQSSFGPDMAANIAKTEGFVREAAKRGAQLVLPSELFQSIYFPTRQDPKWFETAKPVAEHPSVRALQRLAKELNIVIPISFFEKDGPRYYNSVAVADAGLATQASRRGRRRRARSASASAGTNGTRKPRAP
jgi:N-carbamoylputrescine amidase